MANKKSNEEQFLLSRRTFLRSAAFQASSLAAFWPVGLRAGDQGRSGELPSVRRITNGPRFHWFGYYDKFQFSTDNRLVLGNEVGFEGRSPGPDDSIAVGLIDLHDHDRWLELGTSRAWNWQQGCMLQWVPGSKTEVIWNDRDEDRFISHILNVRTQKRRTLPNPIYNISPDGKVAIAPDFRRLNDCRPGYGYAGIVDPNRNLDAPEDAGIWRMDMATGRQTLLFSFADALKVPFTGRKEFSFVPGAKHWFNHLLFNPSGTRFFFLHRWRNPGQTAFQTRAFTCDRDGKNWFCIDPYGATSHFIWRDPRHIMAWAWHPSHGERFYLYKDQSTEVQVVGLDDMTQNGHNTYLPGTNNRWILNDTYPDPARYQHPYLYHPESRRKIPLGQFLSPAQYTGEWRCDTHPRASRDGRLVCIDSPHEGGRQMFLIDLKGII